MPYNPFEALLGGEEDFGSMMTPEKRAALAASLRRDQDYGTLMQLMGTAPTVKAGENLQQQSNVGLKLAVDRQLNTDENRRRSMERQQTQANWDKNFSADEAYRRAMLDKKPDPSDKHRWQYNPVTGEYFDAAAEQQPNVPEAPPRDPSAPPPLGFSEAPPGLKMTETQEKSRYYAQNMAQSLPRMIMHLQNGYKPQYIDLLTSGPQASGVGGLVQQNMPRAMTNPQGREFYTEGRTVLAALLRKESGAAITDDEWKNYGPIWLPWPGDTDDEIERKLVRLQSAMTEMAMGAGPSARFWQNPNTGQGIGMGRKGADSGVTYKYDAEGNPVQ